jgi:hypothetical protein
MAASLPVEEDEDAALLLLPLLPPPPNKFPKIDLRFSFLLVVVARLLAEAEAKLVLLSEVGNVAFPPLSLLCEGYRFESGLLCM